MNCTWINKTRDASWKKYYPQLEFLADKTCELLKLTEEMSLSIILVKSKKIHEINKIYRQIDHPTDVISFALCDSKDDYDLPSEVKDLGDVFINVDAVVDQAKTYNHSEQRELCFLFVHGLLHCLGYDHMTRNDEKKMVDMQQKILDEVVPR